MAKIWVYVDHFKGSSAPSSWEALGVARRLAGETGAQVTALVFGQGVDDLVQKAGEKFGPTDDALDTEVVFRLHNEPERLFGFTLRDDGDARAHRAMFDLLRDAFQDGQRVVHVNYQTAAGKTSGIVNRLWVERGTLPKPGKK